jgi:hypothetical protein
MPTAMELIEAELVQIKTWTTEKVAEGLVPTNEEVARIGGIVTELQKAVTDERRQRVVSMDSFGSIEVREGKYAGLGAVELGILRGILEERLIRGKVTPEPIIAVKTAQQDLANSMTFDSVRAWEERCLKAQGLAHGFESGPGMMKFRDSLAGWRQAFFAEVHQRSIIGKAMDSTTAGKGDELVPTLEAAQLWMDVNLETNVLGLLRQTPMPSNPYEIPLQLGDVNWYPTTQNESGITTGLATAKTTLTAQELKAGVPFSDELNEDAIIQMLSEIRSGLARNAAEIIDDVLLNADQTATDGINADGATITVTTAGKAQYLLGFDGLIHAALIDNTSQTTALATAPTAAMYNTNLLKLGKYAAPKRRGNVVHLADVNTVIKSLTLDEVETVDKMGPRATISSGELAGVYGIPLVASEQMLLASADGKVTDAGGNTTGRVLTFNTTQWVVGFRRGVTFEPDREPGKSQTTLYVSFRIALTERSGTKSTQSHTALIRDISSVT